MTRRLGECQTSYPSRPAQKIARVRGNQADISTCWYPSLTPTSYANATAVQMTQRAIPLTNPDKPLFGRQ